MASVNNMGGEEIQDESEIIVPVIPVVEISRNGHSRMRRAWESSAHHDSDDDINNVNESYENGNDDETVATSARPHPVSPLRHKSVNGKHQIDMTPPDQKLIRAENNARKLASDGKADKAIEEYIKCLAYSRIVFGVSHWKHAQSVINLGEAYLNLKGYYTQAEYHAENARSLMLHGSHTASSVEEKSDLFAVLIKIYRVIGQAATALKKYTAAEDALRKADNISQERSKLSCVTDKECNMLDILLYQAMARLYAKQKKYALASEKYDKVIELMEAEYGKDSIQVMYAYTEYGKLEQSKGRHANHDKTIRLFLQAYSIASAIYKVGHPELVDTALALSQAYASTGWEEAEVSALSYLEESLRTCMTIHGPNHAKTVEVQYHLAKMMIRTNKTKEAMQILKSSLPAKCEAFGDYSEQVSDTYKLIGSIHLSEGNIETALRNYKKCHAIENILLGRNHKKTKDTQRTMEMLMSNPSVSSKFVLNKEDELQKRPRFNNVVGRMK
uniref:MalT-like TPR region domain-containing protein n=2 Tax=Arion vulgaris TaxID=1028688 RepID=A0A0B6Z0Z5_9EUPU